MALYFLLLNFRRPFEKYLASHLKKGINRLRLYFLKIMIQQNKVRVYIYCGFLSLQEKKKDKQLLQQSSPQTPFFYKW